MKNIVFLEEFTPDTDYDKKVHIEPNFGIWNNDAQMQKIELLFDKSINTYVFERTWHKNQNCYQNEDGTVYLSLESNQIQKHFCWFRSDFKSVGTQVTVQRETGKDDAENLSW